MKKKSLLSQLELAYAPITAYEFAIMKNDKGVELALENSSLYIIAQRPVLSFENFYFEQTDYSLRFDIQQKDNSEVLKCIFPLDQENLETKVDDTIAVAFNFYENANFKDTAIYSNIHGFSLLNQKEESREFLIWLSPEKLLQNWWKGHIDCSISGDFRKLLNYNVLYVGQATKQKILKRLTGHSTFQDILSIESPVTPRQLPANEIVVLFFEFYENLQFQTFDHKSKNKELVDAFTGKNYPNQSKVFLDAEKALIKAIQPKYNKELFENYPQSKDGLYGDNYDCVTYTFMDPIKLIYKNGDIQGNIDVWGGDYISIIENKYFEINKRTIDKNT